MSGLSRVIVLISGCVALLLYGVAHADGMLPETTVVILYEENGEATINIKNTDPTPALLHSVIENVPDRKSVV